jgi:hypothetical protein
VSTTGGGGRASGLGGFLGILAGGGNRGSRGWQVARKGSTDCYETLRKDHKLRVLSGGLFKKI